MVNGHYLGEKELKMQHDDFEQWVRNRSRSCMESAEIDEICKGHLDFDSGEYWFFDNAV